MLDNLSNEFQTPELIQRREMLKQRVLECQAIDKQIRAIIKNSSTPISDQDRAKIDQLLKKGLPLTDEMKVLQDQANGILDKKPVPTIEATMQMLQAAHAIHQVMEQLIHYNNNREKKDDKTQVVTNAILALAELKVRILKSEVESPLQAAEQLVQTLQAGIISPTLSDDKNKTSLCCRFQEAQSQYTKTDQTPQANAAPLSPESQKLLLVIKELKNAFIDYQHQQSRGNSWSQLMRTGIMAKSPAEKAEIVEGQLRQLTTLETKLMAGENVSTKEAFDQCKTAATALSTPGLVAEVGRVCDRAEGPGSVVKCESKQRHSLN